MHTTVTPGHTPSPVAVGCTIGVDGGTHGGVTWCMGTPSPHTITTW